jgi:hypothetical protein
MTANIDRALGRASEGALPPAPLGPMRPGIVLDDTPQAHLRKRRRQVYLAILVCACVLTIGLAWSRAGV